MARGTQSPRGTQHSLRKAAWERQEGAGQEDAPRLGLRGGPSGSLDP